MKKSIKTLAALSFCIILVLALTACSSSNAGSSSQSDGQETAEQEEVKQEPLDLTGNWVQKGEEGSESYMAGFIKDGVIELFWISDNGTANREVCTGQVPTLHLPNRGIPTHGIPSTTRSRRIMPCLPPLTTPKRFPMRTEKSATASP